MLFVRKLEMGDGEEEAGDDGEESGDGEDDWQEADREQEDVVLQEAGELLLLLQQGDGGE